MRRFVRNAGMGCIAGNKMKLIKIAPFWRNPVFYGSLGFILLTVPCLNYFFMGNTRNNGH